jgi:hypothetical protein
MNQTNFPAFSTSHGEAIRDLHYRSGLSFADLGRWAGVSESTVKAWSNDINGGPGWRELILWLGNDKLPDTAKLRLLRGLTAGTGIKVEVGDKPSLDELDADQDGDVDHRDVLIHASEIIATAGTEVRDLSKAQAQRRLYAEQIEATRRSVQKVIDVAAKLNAALDHLQLERRMLNGSTNGRRVAVAG